VHPYIIRDKRCHDGLKKVTFFRNSGLLLDVIAGFERTAIAQSVD
jgi:hypothetical protein